MTRAVIRNISTDSKGRAVVLMVLDTTPQALTEAISVSNVTIDILGRKPASVGAIAPRPPIEGKGGQLCTWLSARCKEQHFWRFLNSRYGRNVTSADTALMAVKNIVQFASRRSLDNDPDINVRFRNMIMLELSRWTNKR